MVLNRLIEIVDTMTRRIINIVCIQETKWVVRKSREFEHKLFNYGIHKKIKIEMEQGSHDSHLVLQLFVNEI